MALGTSCSEPQRSSNLAQCLQDIDAVGYDIDKFWFGTQYAIDCPAGPLTSIDCSNPRPQDTKRSVFGRLFATGYPGELDRYLKVVYTSAPGKTTLIRRQSKMLCQSANANKKPLKRASDCKLSQICDGLHIEPRVLTVTNVF